MVAGVPLAARCVHLALSQGRARRDTHCILLAPGGLRISAHCAAEMIRLAPGVVSTCADARSVQQDERSIDALALISQGEMPEPLPIGAILKEYALCDPAHIDTALRRASKRIVKATAKPSDGLVSRHLNRPISQFLSARLLPWRRIRPIHATLAAALVGAAMLLALVFGGDEGLVLGAILFQLASIIDGVDGEIARATFRSSQRGATLDTACDAATNLAFVAGLAFNLWMQGAQLSALAALTAIVLLATGLTLLGVRSTTKGGALSFDLVKNELRGGKAGSAKLLASITSRDVYALFFAVWVVLGWAHIAVTLFLVAVICWLAVIGYFFCFKF